MPRMRLLQNYASGDDGIPKFSHILSVWILSTRLWELDFCRSNHDAFTLVVVLCWRRIFDAILNLCFLSSIRLLLASQPGEIICRSEYLPVWNSKTCVFYTSKRFFLLQENVSFRKKVNLFCFVFSKILWEF